MTELEVKLVKVDNWGIFFLQRLKHFFNRTDYCDLTLQFQDNAQLKVHRLVLSACTEYFELLERTCEMYEDCLVMPDDLQADVVVPIVNFMYTGQLEFRMDLLERLYQTSQVMNMPVLTKLLDAHRSQATITALKPTLKYTNSNRSYSKSKDTHRPKQTSAIVSSSKRPYAKAFGKVVVSPENEIKKPLVMHRQESSKTNNSSPTVPTPYLSPSIQPSSASSKKSGPLRDPRPTRYELPEELDTDNIFDSSFTNISYTSQPLMVHPDTTKQYQRKKSGLFGESSGSRKLEGGTSTMDIVECTRVPKKESIFEDDNSGTTDDLEMFHIRDQNSPNVSNQLFDQIIDEPTGPKVTIETKNAKQAGNIDHAKIISEVLKKYPHLVKSNKNIKLKILNTPSNTTPSKSKPKKQRNSPTPYHQDKDIRQMSESIDSTFETDVLDSKEAARLIGLGAENVKGPWICLICGTPGRALHFTTYYKFRRHLVEVHNEKPVANMCEHCGLKSLKRNYLLYHLLTKHGVEPPPQYNFPKCNICNYVALTEGLLVKHKTTHTDLKSFRCNVCPASYNTSNQLLTHIQATGHKYCADRKTNLQCIYCQRVFLREGNLYAHLKTYHKQSAKSDGIIDDSDDETQKEKDTPVIKYEPSYEVEYHNSKDVESQYQILPDGNIELVTKNRQVPAPTKQKILNSGFEVPIDKPVQKAKQKPLVKNDIPIEPEEHLEEIVMIDNKEYIMKNNQLIPKRKLDDTFVLPDMLEAEDNETLTPSTSMNYSNMQDTTVGEDLNEQKMIIKKASNMNQSIQIVVSNEEEYKALMNSNHSIIFEDGDANKTLTVLSTPQNTHVNPSLDLDTVQSNNMMIIQDDYPISVSETITGDNSNIVVVYSHAMDDQNKQYQIITSQDIGAQFVQSSAVISQNLVTPTPAAPILTKPQVIDSQITPTAPWQTHDENGQRPPELLEYQEMEIVETSQISTPVEQQQIDSVVDNAVITPTYTEMKPVMEQMNEAPVEHTEMVTLMPASIDVNHLPEVMAEVSQVNQEASETEDALPQTHEDIIIANTALTTDPAEIENEELKGDENINTSSTPINVDISTKSSTESSVDITKSVLEHSTNESVSQITVSIEAEDSAIDDGNVENQSKNIEQHTEIGVDKQEELISDATKEINNTPEKTETDTADVEKEDVPTEENNSSTITAEESNTVIPEKARVQIQSLASDWSEDEYDTEVQEQVNKNTDKDDEINMPEIETTEIEESIENIQHEMEKQINDISETGDTEDSVSENVTSMPEEIVNSSATEAPQVKISSLLNDWDENDSQEGNDSTNGIEDEPAVVEAEKQPDDNIQDNKDPKKIDKIQSLVSDWDDDEEDSKLT